MISSKAPTGTKKTYFLSAPGVKIWASDYRVWEMHEGHGALPFQSTSTQPNTDKPVTSRDVHIHSVSIGVSLTLGQVFSANTSQLFLLSLALPYGQLEPGAEAVPLA